MLVKAILDDKAEDGVKYIVIDKLIHSQIANTVRLINGMKKNTIKSGNEENTKYQIEKERKKLKRNRKKKQESQLDPLILALVNTEEFKYNFNQVKELTIYQFNKCYSQIQTKKNYDNTMNGVYSGTLDTEKVDKKNLTWISFSN